MILTQPIDPHVYLESEFYEIPDVPVAWCSHKGFGRRSYNPRGIDRNTAQWYLKLQHKDRPLYSSPIAVDFYFFMPMPESFPKKLRKIVEKREYVVFHDKRPDRTNLLKFAEDCLTGIVITDDNIICEGVCRKMYAVNPKTVILIRPIEKKIGSKEEKA